VVSSTPVNPAELFLQSPHTGTAEDLMRAYARYLLNASGGYQFPVELDKVRRHFHLPVPKAAALPGQRGFSTSDLQIFLNASDPRTVQQFTLAHELMEYLFFALGSGKAEAWISDTLFDRLTERKERLCDIGAAELIMPMDLFIEEVPRPLHIPWVQDLATRCGLSLTATLWRVLETGLMPAILISWRYGYAPKDVLPSSHGQLNLFGSPEVMDPQKKMRVVRVIASAGFDGYIPPDKSAPLDSTIHRAYIDNTFVSGIDELDLVGLRGRYLVQCFPFTSNGERYVMSLIGREEID
jgi:IrrE N-terminal-like domain